MNELVRLGSKSVRISRPAASALFQAAFCQHYTPRGLNEEIDVLNHKSFSTLARAKKWAEKQLLGA